METQAERYDFSAASFSWWSDAHNHLHQSTWLQATLSDLDEKIEKILNLIQEDDGVSFAGRAEMFCKRRPELLKNLRNLHMSYRSLAEKYDRLRHMISPPSFPINLFHSTGNENTNHNTNKSSFSIQQENNTEETQTSSISNEPTISEKEEDIVDGNCGNDDHPEMGNQEKEKIWSRLRFKMSKLIEDNLSQQTELIRRNGDKREVIKQLRAEINRLMEENRVLKSCLPNYNEVRDIKRTESRVSKLKGLNCIGNFQS